MVADANQSHQDRAMPAPQITVWPGADGTAETKTAGADATFEVSVTPDGATVTWLFKDQPITAGDHYQLDENNRKLTIKNATAADSGTWKIEAKTNGDTATKSFELQVSADAAQTEPSSDAPGEWDKSYANR